MSAMRVAIYARYSSDLQRETSIDDQVAVASRYADEQGWTVLDECVYTDAGISGSSLGGRPGVLALLDAAAQQPRPFDALLVDDSSRVARDLRDALHVMRTLTFHGVRTIYISQQIDSNNEQAETLLTVHGLVDGLYLQEMTKKIRRGLAGQHDRGFHTGGKTYGYRTQPVLDATGRRDASGPIVLGKRLVIDADQTTVIRRIFDLYTDGTSMPQIADCLTADGVPGPRGTRWTKNTITRLLTNERYLGYQIWGQHTFEREPGTNRKVRRARPGDEWRVAERPELRIVSDDLWERAQTRRTQLRGESGGGRPQGGRRGLYSRHLLVGLGRCTVCGKAISIVAGGHGSPRYGCPNSWQNGLTACDNRLTVMAKVADPLLLEGLQRELLRPELVREITRAVTADISGRRKAHPSRRKSLRKRREAVADKLHHLVAAIEGGMAYSFFDRGDRGP